MGEEGASEEEEEMEYSSDEANNLIYSEMTNTTGNRKLSAKDLL